MLGSRTAILIPLFQWHDIYAGALNSEAATTQGGGTHLVLKSNMAVNSRVRGEALGSLDGGEGSEGHHETA